MVKLTFFLRHSSSIWFILYVYVVFQIYLGPLMSCMAGRTTSSSGLIIYFRTLNVLVISKCGSSILLSCMHACSPLELCKAYRTLLPGLLFDSGCFSYLYWQDHFIKQGSLACCHPRGCKESVSTKQQLYKTFLHQSSFELIKYFLLMHLF